MGRMVKTYYWIVRDVQLSIICIVCTVVGNVSFCLTADRCASCWVIRIVYVIVVGVVHCRGGTVIYSIFCGGAESNSYPYSLQEYSSRWYDDKQTKQFNRVKNILTLIQNGAQRVLILWVKVNRVCTAVCCLAKKCRSSPSFIWFGLHQRQPERHCSCVFCVIYDLAVHQMSAVCTGMCCYCFHSLMFANRKESQCVSNVWWMLLFHILWSVMSQCWGGHHREKKVFNVRSKKGNICKKVTVQQ